MWGWYSGVQKAARDLARRFGFQAAGLRARPAFQAHLSCPFPNPVDRSCAMVGQQPVQRPVRAGQHLNAALDSHQNGEVGDHLPRGRDSFGRLEDVLRVLQKPAHGDLIGAGDDFFAAGALSGRACVR